MKKKRLVVFAAIVTAMVSFGELPAAAELREAREKVLEAMKDIRSDFEKGDKVSEEVAEYALSLVDKTDDKAQKYLLYKGAMSFFIRANRQDRAAETAVAMLGAMSGVGEGKMISLGMDQAGLEFHIGEKLEFVKCPAGEFTMGYGERTEKGSMKKAHKAFTPHKVKITKPFYIGKYKITNAQLRDLEKLCGLKRNTYENRKQSTKELKLLGGDDYGVAFYRRDALDELCARLTEIYRGKIPEGYVFRLPTDAEWEYAAKAGKGGKGVFGSGVFAKSVNGKYLQRVETEQIESGVLRKNPRLEDRNATPWWKIGWHVGKSVPNEWGIYDMYSIVQPEQVFDIVAAGKNYKGPGSGAPSGSAGYDLEYDGSEEVDPVRMDEVEQCIGIMRGFVDFGQEYRNGYERNMQGHELKTAVLDRYDMRSFRLAIAPDVKTLNRYPGIKKR